MRKPFIPIIELPMNGSSKNPATVNTASTPLRAMGKAISSPACRPNIEAMDAGAYTSPDAMVAGALP